MIQAKPSETSSNHNLKLNTYYGSNLKIIKNEAQPNDWDCLAIFFGFEGTGKSTLMFQSAKFLDPGFNLSRVVFTPEQFNKVVDEAPVGSCVVWDEAITGATASQHARSINQAVISKLTQIRKKKMIFFLGFPYLHMLGKYFVSRCLFSCYVYAKDFNDRGYFSFYDFKKTNILYNVMKGQFNNYPIAALNIYSKNFSGTFGKKIPFSAKDYDDKKEEARLTERKTTGGLSKEDKTKMVKRARDLGISMGKLAKIMDVSKQTVYNYLSE